LAPFAKFRRISDPYFWGRETDRDPLRGHGQRGLHQNAFIVEAFDGSDPFESLMTGAVEITGVLGDEPQRFHSTALIRSRSMRGQNGGGLDRRIVKKSVASTQVARISLINTRQGEVGVFH